MHTESNYPEILFEIVLELVSKQSLPELMASRLISPQWRIAADCALFARQDEQAIGHQERLLQLWSNKNPAQMSALFPKWQGLFKRHLLASIQSPASNPYHRLSGLRVLATINGYSVAMSPKVIDDCSIYISPEVIDGLLTKLDDKARKVSIAALKALPTLVNHMSEQQRTTLIDKTTSNLSSPDLFIQVAALEAFPSIAGFMTEAQCKRLIAVAIDNLNNSANEVSTIAIQACLAMSNTKNTALLTTFITQIEEKLNDRDNFSSLTALKVLSAFAGNMSQAQIGNLITRVEEELDNRSPEACVNALKTVSLIARLMTKEQRLSLIDRVKDKLNNSDARVCEVALDTYLTITDKNDADQIATCVSELENILDDRGWEVRKDALKALPVIASFITEGQRQILITAVEAKLGEPMSWVYEAALDAYWAIIDKKNADQIARFINKISETLNDRLYAHSATLKMLSSITSFMNDTQFKAFLTQVIVKLDDPNADVYMAALEACSSITRLINETQRAALITKATDRLKDSGWDVRIAALRACLAINNKNTDEPVEILITEIATELKDLDHWVVKEALKAYSSIAIYMNEKQIAESLKLVAEKIDDQHTSVGAAAFEALSALASGVTDKSINQQLSALPSTFLNDVGRKRRQQALKLASTLVVLGKYQNTDSAQQVAPSVEALIFEGLKQIYSPNAVYGKSESDGKKASTAESTGMPGLTANAGAGGALTGAGFFGVRTVQVTTPETSLNTPAV